MTTDLFISELLYAIISTVAYILVYQFSIYRDGELRRLMIFYWCCQFWATAWSGVYFFMQHKGIAPVSFGVGRIMSLAPLALSMIWFLLYIIKVNKRQNGNN